MASKDAPAEGPPAAGNVLAEGAAVRCPTPSEGATPVHPRWLRPTVVSAVILAHGLALVALANISRQAPPAEETIEVKVIAAGDEAPVTTSAAQAASEASNQTGPEPSKAPNEPAPQTPAADSAPAVETAPVAEEQPSPPPPTEASVPPDTPPPAEAKPPPADQPPPSIEAQIEPLPPPPDAPPPRVAALTPAAPPSPPAEAPPEAPPAARAPQLRSEPQPRPKPQAKLEQPERSKPDEKALTAERAKPRKPVESGSGGGAKASAAKTGAAEAHHVGEANGQTVDVGMSRASYAALVVAQIQAHKFYPESARARGEQGAVGVSFTIGPSGRVGSASVVRSSGFADLDGAARDILHAIAPPPPPGGSFSASTTIRFHFE